jgi:hypothetical protein
MHFYGIKLKLFFLTLFSVLMLHKFILFSLLSLLLTFFLMLGLNQPNELPVYVFY